MAEIDTLLSLRSHLTGIVHHIPGRIRLRFSPGLLKLVDQIDLSVFDHLGIFKGIQFNPLAFSVTITYDPERLLPPLWEAFISGDRDAEKQISQLWADHHQPVSGVDGPPPGSESPKSRK